MCGSRVGRSSAEQFHLVDESLQAHIAYYGTLHQHLDSPGTIQSSHNEHNTVLINKLNCVYEGDTKLPAAALARKCKTPYLVMLRKVLMDLRLESDKHENLTTSRGSSIANAYHVCSTSITSFSSYLAHRQTHRYTHMVITIPAPPLYADQPNF